MMWDDHLPVRAGVSGETVDDEPLRPSTESLERSSSAII